MEEEKVVTDQFHLVQRVIDRHRLGRVFLGAHDLTGAVAIINLGTVMTVRAVRGDGRRESVGRQDGGGLGERNRRLVPVVNLAAVTAPTQPAFQLGDGSFERAVERVGACLAADNRPRPRAVISTRWQLFFWRRLRSCSSSTSKR